MFLYNFQIASSKITAASLGMLQHFLSSVRIYCQNIFELSSYLLFLRFWRLAFSWAGRPPKGRHAGPGDRGGRQIEGLALEFIVGEREHFPLIMLKKWLGFSWVNSLANIKESWPGVWLSLPTFQHQTAKIVGAVFGRCWMLTTLYVGLDFFVWKPLIGKLR